MSPAADRDESGRLPTSDGGRELPVAEEWFAARQVAEGITRIWEPYVHDLMQANIWHVRGRESDLLVDAGMGLGDLPAALAGWGLTGEGPLLLFITHAHADHHGGAHRFWPRIVHPAEAVRLSDESDWHPLLAAEYSPDLWDTLAAEEAEDGGAGGTAPGGEPDAGVPRDGLLVSALPSAGFRPAEHTVVPAVPALQMGEGDVVDLGDRRFRVLHLPGHSPGSIGLWEERSGTLFAGDVIYVGALLDELDGSSVADYCATMRRLLDLPVEIVYAGHGAPFGRELLREQARAYLRRRCGASGRGVTASPAPG